ncbi:hypothetical protein [Helicobacter equorum]|uniref:hypothetical protein n=1 Tax=Helicobacter equorum TaxID=361872 RepID=UPI000CF16008|nr:hypothetical protein [Helicobacter equorum]
MKDKTLDEQLEYLKGIGIKEINKTTRLATNKIDDILQKRFDKIEDVRAKGFVSMLEREYGLDLSDWLKEYALYHNKISQPNPQPEVAPKASSVADIDIKQKSQTPKAHKEVSTMIKDLKLPKKDLQETTNIKQPASEQKNNVANVVFFVFLGAVVVGCVLYLGYKMFMKPASIARKVDMPKPQPSEIVILEEIQTSHTSSDNEATNDETSSNKTTRDQDLQSQSLVDSPDSQDATNTQASNKSDYDGIYIDFNALPQNPQTSIKETPLPEQLPQREIVDRVLPQPISKLTIMPNSALWVGVVDLTNNKSTHLNLNNTYDIDLDRRYIFVFGHSDFESLVDNQTFQHRTQNFVRFYYDGVSLKEINYATYRRLHPQDNW